MQMHMGATSDGEPASSSGGNAFTLIELLVILNPLNLLAAFAFYSV
jgi:Tfp pilus assembly protein FimT